MTNDQIYKILSKSALVDPHQLGTLFQQAQKQNISLYELLLGKDVISDEVFGKTAADFLDFPFINLHKVAIRDEVLNIIPEITAKKQRVIAFKKDSNGLHLAMNDPDNLEIQEFVKKKAGDEVIPYFATERDLDDALELYRKGLEEEFGEIIKKTAAAAKGVKETEAPIIKIVDTIISYANSNKASDIHIEPRDEDSIVRFRIDGVLHDVVTVPKELHPQVVSRIKVMARLRTDEHQAAQDGKIVFEVKE